MPGSNLDRLLSEEQVALSVTIESRDIAKLAVDDLVLSAENMAFTMAT